MLYDDDAYVESPDRRTGGSSNRGLWGRHVAGKEFLDAYLTHGNWDEVVALVRNRPSRQSITSFCRNHPSSRARQRRLKIIQESEFLRAFGDPPAANVLYTPQPPDERYAWARQRQRVPSFAICGLTHTLCSARAVRWLISLVTAPFEEYDVLICTSRSVVQMLHALFDSYTGYLQERFGGTPRLKPRLELVPLGVNTERFRPPSAEERAEHRAAIHASDEEVVVLFVGRLSVHGKAHPFPIFHGLQQATQRTGKKIHLALSGWAKTKPLLQTFIDGAREFAPDVRLTIVDGTKPRMRFGAWMAADVFTSLSDNIQETFGLVIVEAMASGLPVVASDWDGYRDLVVDGETGYLIPTAMVPGATEDTTAELLMGAMDYDRFIGQCNQATVVDLAAAADAFTRLVADPAHRRRMGANGRKRACDTFRWERIVKAYETIWQDQVDRLQRSPSPPRMRHATRPSMYPPPEQSFSGYPSRWLDNALNLAAPPGGAERLERLLSMPLTNYAGECRVSDPNALRAVMEEARRPRQLGALKASLLMGPADVSPQSACATLAWMLKYGLLHTVD